MRRQQQDPRTAAGQGRARPRYYAMPGEAKRVEVERPTQDGRRRRTAAPPPRKKPARVLPILALVILLALTGFAALNFLDMSRAEQQLTALREERAAAVKQHRDDVGYYVSMRRASGYLDTIRQYAQEFQVDPSFLSAIIARESHYDPRAQSGVGARGLMQIMQDTGDWIAGRLGISNYNYDSLFDPTLNIRFGAWYINYLSAHFDGDPVMVASAYHAGLNNVKLWALNRGADKKTISAEQIPMDNTRDYVQKVMRAYALFYEYDSGNFDAGNAT